MIRTGTRRRVVVSSFGTTGDVDPMLALSAELARHGHRVVVALPSIFSERARSLGLDWVALGPPVDMELVRRTALLVASARSPLWQARRYARYALGSLRRMFRDLTELCEDADLLICSQSQPAGRMVHDATGIAFVSVQVQHFNVPSAYRFVPTVPTLPLGPFNQTWNRLQWQALGFALRAWTAAPINRYRVAEGLPPLPEPLLRDASSPVLNLCAVSPSIAELPPDCPTHFRATGFFVGRFTDWNPGPRFMDFVSNGPAPIAAAFGSTVFAHPGAIAQALAEAAEDVGCRLVVERGWGDLPIRAEWRHVQAIDFAPYMWLFAHAACVIHHGGPGTTAASFLAGLPAIVFPQMFDHAAWAAVSKRRGISGRPLPKRAFTRRRLAQEIANIQKEPAYKAAAAQLAEELAGEDGVGTARRLIESVT